ncbi:MAG: SDR family NAD(P)-dependent oxidoreductase, partial [Nitratireductor sp.]|nr:SDR family NAD(P)-dependent oxidoreductase [Nitratireductor sp.]
MASGKTLENKVAIVTGGAQGIGYAIAERYLREGAEVVICDIDDDQGEAAETALRKIGRTKYLHCNVAEKLDVHNMVASALDEFG